MAERDYPFVSVGQASSRAGPLLCFGRLGFWPGRAPALFLKARLLALPGLLRPKTYEVATDFTFRRPDFSPAERPMRENLETRERS